MIEFLGGIVVGAGLQYVFMLYLGGTAAKKKPKWVPVELPLRTGVNYLCRDGKQVSVHSVDDGVAFIRWGSLMVDFIASTGRLERHGPTSYDVTHQEASEP